MGEHRQPDDTHAPDQSRITTAATKDSIQAASAMTRQIAAQARLAADLNQKFTQAAHDMSEGLGALTVLPTAAVSGFEDLQWSANWFFEAMMRSNLRAAQDMMRLAYPKAHIELQQRVAREYMELFSKGNAAMLSAARRTAEETLRSAATGEASYNARPENRGARSQRVARVADVMSRGIRVANPDDTVQQAAQLMREEHTGVLPVGENDRLVGLVTDHDVAIHLVAEARDPAQTKVREVMRREVRYLFEDVDLQHAADILGEQQIPRLPVVSREKRLVGMVSLVDLAAEGHTPRTPDHAPVARERSDQAAAAE
jgi:CBS domain-containing protein